MKLACSTVFVCFNYFTRFSNDDFSSLKNWAKELRLLRYIGYLSGICVAVHNVFRSSVVFTTKMKMKLLQLVHAISQGTPAKSTCSFGLVDIQCWRVSIVDDLSTDITGVITSKLQTLAVRGLYSRACFNVDGRLGTLVTVSRYFSPVLGTVNCKKYIHPS